MLVVLLAMLGWTHGYSQNSDDARDVTDTYFFKNANVVQKPGTVLANTSVLIQNGIITGVGKNIVVPYDAHVIDADSMYLYAAFIDAATHAGLKKEEKKNTERAKDPGNPTNEQAGVTPQAKASDMIDAKSKDLEAMRKLGYGYLHVMPKGRMLPGQSVVISTGEGDVSDIVIKDHPAMFAQLASARGVFPATIIGVMSKHREFYKNAQLNKSYRAKYAMNPKGLTRPEASKEYQSFDNVIDKRQPVYFAAEKTRDIFRVLTLQKELGFDLVLVDAKQANMLTSKMRSQNIPVIVSLELPKKVEDKKDDKKAEEKKDEDPYKAKFDARKKEAYAKYESQAADLMNAGVTVAFSGLSVKTSDIKESLDRLIERGLTKDQALAGLTTNAAKLAGISNVAGTVESGKLANIFVSNKPYFDEDAKIKYTVADGKLYQYKEKPKAKKTEGATMDDLSGMWSYDLEIPGQPASGRVEVTKDGDSYKVRIDSSEDPGEWEDATNVKMSGETMTFDMSIDDSGMTLDIKGNLKFTADEFDGTLSISGMGDLPISGTKTSGPK